MSFQVVNFQQSDINNSSKVTVEDVLDNLDIDILRRGDGSKDTSGMCSDIGCMECLG